MMTPSPFLESQIAPSKHHYSCSLIVEYATLISAPAQGCWAFDFISRPIGCETSAGLPAPNPRTLLKSFLRSLLSYCFFIWTFVQILKGLCVYWSPHLIEFDYLPQLLWCLLKLAFLLLLWWSFWAKSFLIKSRYLTISYWFYLDLKLKSLHQHSFFPVLGWFLQFQILYFALTVLLENFVAPESWRSCWRSPTIGQTTYWIISCSRSAFAWWSGAGQKLRCFERHLPIWYSSVGWQVLLVQLS